MIKKKTTKAPTKKKDVNTLIKKNLELIKDLRKNGHSIEGISRSLGISRATFYNHLKDNEELVHALSVAEYEFNQVLKESAMQRAVGFVKTLTETRKEYKNIVQLSEDGEFLKEERVLVKEFEVTKEQFIYSDVLALKLLGLDKYKNIDDLPTELKELFEEFRQKVNGEENGD